MKRKGHTAALGRPRGFDADKALDRALEVFWRKGYEGTAISDLTAAMQINRPSIYAAFGNKEQLFRKVLDRYAEGPASAVRAALDAPTARQAVERVLLAAAYVPTRGERPRGCLLVQGALACGDASESVRRELIARRADGEAELRKRLQRAEAEGDLSPSVDPAALARYVMTLAYGMAVEAASGASYRELLQVVETAMKAWPS